MDNEWRCMATGYYCRACDKSIVYPLGDDGVEKCASCKATALKPLSAHRVTDENGNEYGGLLVLLSAISNREQKFGRLPLILDHNLDYYWINIWHNQILELANIPKVKITDADVRNALICSICLETFSAGQLFGKTKCRHVFHNNCIGEWLTKHTTCPNCRAHIEITREVDDD